MSDKKTNSTLKELLVIICSYNSKDYTKKLYEEIKDVSSIDIMILDNSSEENEIPDFGNCRHIGYDNVEFGGMHDYVLNSNLLNEYKFIGIFNNDIFGFTPRHFQVLRTYLNDNNGYISFSISPEYDKSAGIMQTKKQKNFRESRFIENVAPIYNTKLLYELKKYSPISRYAMIDVFMSKKSIEMGMKNIIIDEVSFHHMRSGTRKKVGSYEKYLKNCIAEQIKWFSKNPELIKYWSEDNRENIARKDGYKW